MTTAANDDTFKKWAAKVYRLKFVGKRRPMNIYQEERMFLLGAPVKRWTRIK